jgi:ribulose-phosphate 3-epimerase
LPTSVDDLSEKLSRIPLRIPLVHVDILEEDIWVETDKNIEVHLMTKEPERFLNLWVERGTKRIIVHSLPPLSLLKERGWGEVGLGVELHVPLESIWVELPRVDFIHLMSIKEMGAQGRPFEPEIFDRIREVKERFPELSISVDGGVDENNFKELEKLGVDRVAVGTAFDRLSKLINF